MQAVKGAMGLLRASAEESRLADEARIISAVAVLAVFDRTRTKLPQLSSPATVAAGRHLAKL